MPHWPFGYTWPQVTPVNGNKKKSIIFDRTMSDMPLDIKLHRDISEDCTCGSLRPPQSASSFPSGCPSYDPAAGWSPSGLPQLQMTRSLLPLTPDFFALYIRIWAAAITAHVAARVSRLLVLYYHIHVIGCFWGASWRCQRSERILIFGVVWCTRDPHWLLRTRGSCVCI